MGKKNPKHRKRKKKRKKRETRGVSPNGKFFLI